MKRLFCWKWSRLYKNEWVTRCVITEKKLYVPGCYNTYPRNLLFVFKSQNLKRSARPSCGTWSLVRLLFATACANIDASPPSERIQNRFLACPSIWPRCQKCFSVSWPDILETEMCAGIELVKLQFVNRKEIFASMNVVYGEATTHKRFALATPHARGNIPVRTHSCCRQKWARG